MSDGIDFELIHEDNQHPKKAVLLFHGLTGSPFEMKKYGVFLHKNGFDVFCYSFPGHGERLSEIQTATWNDWCNFAQQKYEQLRPDYDIFFVSGLCLGAAISIYLGERNKDLTGIIALSTTFFLDGASMPWYKFLMPIGLHTIFRYFYTFPEDRSLGIKNEGTRKTLAKLMAKTTVGLDNYPMNCINELLKLSSHVRNNLNKLETPILLIHAKEDNLTSPKSAKVVLAKASSKIKKYIELTNSYHMILYDNDKLFVMDNVKAFIDDLLPANTKADMELKNA